eukprot:1160495-Pelagomonas_calceolata.AAC.4
MHGQCNYICVLSAALQSHLGQQMGLSAGMLPRAIECSHAVQLQVLVDAAGAFRGRTSIYASTEKPCVHPCTRVWGMQACMHVSKRERLTTQSTDEMYVKVMEIKT